MSNAQLFIPNKINVGFQNRSDTYTGKLAYVIYYDSFGKLRKEKSWQGWRDNKIPNQEFENEPTEGFVLNKDVGGARRSYGWNCRNEYVRVYDPRDFEFEISIANLLFILRECDCSRGKGLEGKFVYAWQGTELVLLPTCSVDYENSKKFTELQAKKISAKELIAGATYVTKSQDPMIYLGRFEKWSPFEERSYSYRYDDTENTIKKAAGQKYHVFWNPPKKGTGGRNFAGNFEFLSSMSKLGGVLSDTPVPELADLVTNYYNSKWGSKVIELVLEDPPKGWKRKEDDYSYNRDHLAYETREGSGVYVLYYMSKYKSHYMVTDEKVRIKDDVLTYERYYNESYPPGYQKGYRHHGGEIPWVERKPKKLYAVLESGAKFEVGTSGLKEK